MTVCFVGGCARKPPSPQRCASSYISPSALSNTKPPISPKELDREDGIYGIVAASAGLLAELVEADRQVIGEQRRADQILGRARRPAIARPLHGGGPLARAEIAAPDPH